MYVRVLCGRFHATHHQERDFHHYSNAVPWISNEPDGGKTNSAQSAAPQAPNGQERTPLCAHEHRPPCRVACYGTTMARNTKGKHEQQNRWTSIMYRAMAGTPRPPSRGKKARDTSVAESAPQQVVTIRKKESTFGSEHRDPSQQRVICAATVSVRWRSDRARSSVARSSAVNLRASSPSSVST